MLKKALLLAAASAVSVSAFAGGVDHAPAAKSLPYYAGAQVGYTAHYGFNSTVAADSADSASYSKRQGALGVRTFAGYDLSKTYAVELGLGSFGSQDIAVANATTAKGLANTDKVTTQFSIDASAVGHMPLSHGITGFAKVGAALMQYKQADIADSSDNIKTWKVIPRAEIGASYNVAKNIDATLSYAHYFGLGSLDKVENMGVLAAGMTYSF